MSNIRSSYSFKESHAMCLMKRMFQGLQCLSCVVLISSCGDSGKEQNTQEQSGPVDLVEAQRNLDEAQRLLDQAKADIKQAKKVQDVGPAVPKFVPPADHLEPFDMLFGFGNPDEVAHFWKWTQKWEFTDEQATNKEKPGGAFLTSTYKLSGDFQITLKGKLTQSWTNSQRSYFEVCGHAIGLATWKPVGVDLTVKRAGNQLTYTLGGQEPVVIQLAEDQSGPTQAKLAVYGRYVSVYQLHITADSADRILE